MFKLKSWKTTSMGVLAIVGAITAVAFAPVITAAVIMGAAASALTGVGLIFSKDAEVTGGTKPITPEAAERVLPDNVNAAIEKEVEKAKE